MRVINAAEYGNQQRRRRTFIFAYKNNTKYADRILKSVGYADSLKEKSMENAVLKEGFFAETFPVNKAESTKIKIKELPIEVGEVSETFQCAFENSGIMKDGIIYTMKTVPNYHGKQITLGDVMETGQVEEQYFIPEEKLYYTVESILLGIPFPSIFVATNPDGKWELIDGLQRVSTVLSFFNELKDEDGNPYPKNGLKLVEGSMLKGLKDITIDTLPLEYKLQIKRTPCRVEIILKESEFKMRYELFKRLNTGGE